MSEDENGTIDPESIQPLPIVECGDPVLRQPGHDVDPAVIPTAPFQRLIEQMRMTMDLAPGVGLAAPQIGLPVHLALLQDGPERWDGAPEATRLARERTELPFTVLINPIVEPIEEEGSAAFFEGCLSVPGLAGVVVRARAVRVRALDRTGAAVDAVYVGWPARIVQHEVDHVNGHLYLDRVITRSLATSVNAARWAGVGIDEVAAALGFEITPRAT